MRRNWRECKSLQQLLWDTPQEQRTLKKSRSRACNHPTVSRSSRLLLSAKYPNRRCRDLPPTLQLALVRLRFRWGNQDLLYDNWHVLTSKRSTWWCGVSLWHETCWDDAPPSSQPLVDQKILSLRPRVRAGQTESHTCDECCSVHGQNFNTH